MQTAERDVKFFLKLFGAFLLTTLLITVPVGVLGSSNIVWGESNQYGSIPIPGSKVVHLPAGTVDALVAVELPGRGNQTPDLPLPGNLALTAPASIKVTRHLGDTGNAIADGADTQRQAFKLDVPRAGDYRLTTRGGFLGIAVNPHMWLGHGPPIPGTFVPLIAAVLALIGMVGYFKVWRPRKSRRS